MTHTGHSQTSSGGVVCQVGWPIDRPHAQAAVELDEPGHVALVPGPGVRGQAAAEAILDPTNNWTETKVSYILILVKPKETIERFDLFLEARGLGLDAVVIGGVALALLGVGSRQTRDCDVLDPQIPREIADAAQEFAADVRKGGEQLDDDWLNR